MNWRKWKQYAQTVCVVYTCMVIWKVILEALKGITDAQYGKNLMLMFLITCLATAILHLYEKLQKYPLIPVIIGQYVLVIGIVLGGVFFAEKIGITEIAAVGYWDLSKQDAYEDGGRSRAYGVRIIYIPLVAEFIWEKLLRMRY